MTIFTGGRSSGSLAARGTWRPSRGLAPLVLLDSAVVVIVYVLTTAVRFELAVPEPYWRALLRFLPVAMAAHVTANLAFGLYREIWSHAGIRQAVRVVLACTSVGIGFVSLSLVSQPTMPLSVRVFGPMLAALALTVLRFRARLVASSRAPSGSSASGNGGLRVVVFGGGDAGGAIIREFQRDRSAGMCAVAVLDDDPRKLGLAVAGVRVVGTLDALGDAVARYRAHQVLLAIPSADQATIRRVAAACDRAEVPLRVLPRVQELLGGRISVKDVRELSIEDLVGRRQVTIDIDGVRRALRGRRVLITGAGGSIGSELARQVAALDPASLILLDHDETHLHDLTTTLAADAVTVVLADIRDRAWVDAHMSRLRPDVVFHAAAHKHVPVLERHPAEAFLTNVVGTKNVVESALANGVSLFVLISTDKAVRPTSVMGASKRLAEHVVLSRMGGQAQLCVVRFGNVLGSRGSVVPTFARQINEGGPVTVTDPAMTRYFLSTPEAVQLVLQAAVIAHDRDVLMLDMGEAVNVHELAKRMIRLAGRTPGVDIDIEFTGRRPGEKLAEELVAPSETAGETPHPSVMRISTPVMTQQSVDEVVDRLLLAVDRCDDALVSHALRTIQVWQSAPSAQQRLSF